MLLPICFCQSDFVKICLFLSAALDTPLDIVGSTDMVMACIFVFFSLSITVKILWNIGVTYVHVRLSKYEKKITLCLEIFVTRQPAYVFWQVELNYNFKRMVR